MTASRPISPESVMLLLNRATVAHLAAQDAVDVSDRDEAKFQHILRESLITLIKELSGDDPAQLRARILLIARAYRKG